MNALNTMKIQAKMMLEDLKKIEEINNLLYSILVNTKVEGQTWVFPSDAKVQYAHDRLCELLEVHNERVFPELPSTTFFVD